MCTVVCRWQPGDPFPVQMLALRDELASRDFDPPAAWWPDQPDVVGGRDCRTGGSWCVSDIVAGSTAVVLNRPERRLAEPDAPSRGVLPLLAARHGNVWPRHIDVAGMASFNLVLVAPGGLRWWSFDGQRLDEHELAAGTFMFTPLGLAVDGFDSRLATGHARIGEDGSGHYAEVWADWLTVLHEARPATDPSALIVSLAINQDFYQTVFGQLIAARPGSFRLDYLDFPVRGTAREWTTRLHQPGSASAGVFD